MSDTRSIETPHERRPFQAHGHMDVVTLGEEVQVRLVQADPTSRSVSFELA